MKELSVFIDESGDFGEYDYKSPYYIIAMVTHDQRVDISEPLGYLDRGLSETGLRRNFVHMGPLIRKEAEYSYLSIGDRVKVLRKMINFVAKTDFSYKTFYIEKKHISDDYEMIEKLARQFSEFIRQHYSYFLAFDKIKIYYDNGQAGVMKIIIAVFTALFGSVEYKKALEKDYRLLQVADLVCTAKLTELKMKDKNLSRSERKVLGSDRDIEKSLLKPLRRKEFKD